MRDKFGTDLTVGDFVLVALPTKDILTAMYAAIVTHTFEDTARINVFVDTWQKVTVGVSISQVSRIVTVPKSLLPVATALILEGSMEEGGGE